MNRARAISSVYPAPSNAETYSLLARMTTFPGARRQSEIDTLMTALKGIGLAKFDAFYMLTAHEAATARLNWISTSYNLTEAGTMTFVADQHYFGNGTTGYLTTGFNPTTAPTPKFTQNDNHFGVYVVTGSAIAGNRDFGNTTVGVTITDNTDAIFRNSSTSANGVAQTSIIGHMIASRAASGSYSRYRNATSLGAATQASAALSNEAFYISARNNAGVADQFTVRRMACVHFGSQLSAGEVTTLYNAITAYLLSVRGAV